MYKVELLFLDKSSCVGTIVITDSDGVRKYDDNMEPEDATFMRDLKWIKDELLKAYARGQVDEIMRRNKEYAA